MSASRIANSGWQSPSSERDKQWKLGERSAKEALWRLPLLRNGPFVGREQDMADLHAAFTASTMVGTPLHGFGS